MFMLVATFEGKQVCRDCGDLFDDDDFDGDADDYVCGSCQHDRDEAVREDMGRARRKGEW